MFGNQNIVHSSLIRRAVEKGRNKFTTAIQSKQELQDVFNKFKNDIPFKIPHLDSLKNYSKNGTLRSKLMSLKPSQLVMDEVTKPDQEGDFLVLKASRLLDLHLVLFLMQVGTNKESVVFNPRMEEEELHSIMPACRVTHPLFNSYKTMLERAPMLHPEACMIPYI